MRGWGLPDDGELDRVIVVSPHLDDAVLGCARFMAVHPGVTVVPVFAGNPEAYPEPMRTWDVQSGFAPGDDVFAEAGRLAAAASDPVTDVRGPAEYKRHIIEVFVQRGMARALEQAHAA